MTDTPPAAKTPGEWLTRTEAAAYLNVSAMTIWRAVRDGYLPRHDGAGTRAARYHRTELDALARRTTIVKDTERTTGARLALDTVRARIPRSRPLIAVSAVIDILDGVARDLDPKQ